VREQHCCLSSIVVAEIRYGLAKRSAASRLQALTEATLETQEILPWTVACTRFYGQLRFDLERHGKPLAALDLLIASHALSEGCTLVMAGTTTHDRFTPDIVASPGPCFWAMRCCLVLYRWMTWTWCYAPTCRAWM
jgi:tRNA(fMet)-specific endonuclease VapC